MIQFIFLEKWYLEERFSIMKPLQLKFLGIELFTSHAFKFRISCQRSIFPKSRCLNDIVLWTYSIKTNQFLLLNEFAMNNIALMMELHSTDNGITFRKAYANFYVLKMYSYLLSSNYFLIWRVKVVKKLQQTFSKQI